MVADLAAVLRRHLDLLGLEQCCATDRDDVRCGHIASVHVTVGCVHEHLLHSTVCKCHCNPVRAICGECADGPESHDCRATILSSEPLSFEDLRTRLHLAGSHFEED